MLARYCSIALRVCNVIWTKCRRPSAGSIWRSMMPRSINSLIHRMAVEVGTPAAMHALETDTGFSSSQASVKSSSTSQAGSPKRASVKKRSRSFLPAIIRRTICAICAGANVVVLTDSNAVTRRESFRPIFLSLWPRSETAAPIFSICCCMPEVEARAFKSVASCKKAGTNCRSSACGFMMRSVPATSRNSPSFARPSAAISITPKQSSSKTSLANEMARLRAAASIDASATSRTNQPTGSAGIGNSARSIVLAQLPPSSATFAETQRTSASSADAIMT